MNNAKAVIYLGALRIEYDTPADPHDYQTLVEKTWQVTKLNLAATMEGWNPRDCLPFSEMGAPDAKGKRHKYVGLVHMPTGEKIRFGQQTDGAGGHWYVRSKADEHYRGPERFMNPEDFPAAGELPPASDPAYLEAPPEYSEAAPKKNNTRKKPPQQTALDSGEPAHEKQKEAIERLAIRIFGFDDYSYSDLTALLDSIKLPDLNNLTATEAALAIKTLNQKASGK